MTLGLLKQESSISKQYIVAGAVVMSKPYEVSTYEHVRYDILMDYMTHHYGPIMDLDEVAKALRLKKQTLYQQMYHNKFDIPRMKNGKKYLFHTADVVKHLCKDCGSEHNKNFKCG